ncbi:MAG: hypothetical protein IPM56_08035 [Ignavibacteriales bacterium]|nr:MAG: hypothetical protein IPM56_08035 [Ignavibacteriales bacterium]
MKCKISIAILFLLVICIDQPLVLSQSNASTKSLSNVNTNNKFFIGFNTGYRFNISVDPDLSSNFLFGFSIQLPLSEFVSLQPELNFWKTDLINYPVESKYSVTDFPILLMLNVNYEKTGVDLLFGPGVIVQHDHSDKLISLNIGIGYWIRILERLRLNLESRLQLAGSIEPGGGNSVSSLYLRMGLKYELGN